MFDFIWHRLLRRPYTMRLRYHRTPKHPTHTIVFLHGIASSYSAWRKTVAAISQDPELRSVRLIGLDLIGFGKSQPANYFHYDYMSYTKSLHHTLKKLRIKTPLILAGHSMGCLLSAAYTTRHPDHIQALIMVSPPFLRPADIRKLPDQLHIKGFTKIKNHSDDPLVTSIGTLLSKVSSLDGRSFKTPAFKHCMEQIILNEHIWSTATELKLPTFIIHGRLDPLVGGSSLKILAKQNPHITLIQSVGIHDITLAKRRQVISALKRVILNS